VHRGFESPLKVCNLLCDGVKAWKPLTEEWSVVCERYVTSLE
jgi:hypothetical protein